MAIKWVILGLLLIILGGVTIVMSAENPMLRGVGILILVGGILITALKYEGPFVPA